MKQLIKRLLSLSYQFGVSPLKFYHAIKGLPFFMKDYLQFKKQLKQQIMYPFRTNRMYPCLHDRFSQSGVASGHYFHQDLLVANKIFQNKPLKHIDIGSRIDGFVAHVASFRKIECLDIRNIKSDIPNVLFKQVDCMSKDFNLYDYCDSVSSLHAIEHFGLGRYGDKININGYMDGLDNIYKMLKTGGKFYFSVPIGEQRVEFNAHRVFSVKYLVELFRDKYYIDSFSYVDDNGVLFINVQLDSVKIENNYSCHFGCGIFELIKL
jgi:SAM-dependent methyltransferase